MISSADAEQLKGLINSIEGLNDSAKVGLRKLISGLAGKNVNVGTVYATSVVANTYGIHVDDVEGHTAGVDMSGFPDDDFQSGNIELDGSLAGIALTKWIPTPGRTYNIYCVNADNACTLQLKSGITFLGGANDLATFDAVGEALVVTVAIDGTPVVISNVGSVGLSTYSEE